MALTLRRNRDRSPNRLTLGLAALALGTVGTVLGGEFIRLARRRAAETAGGATHPSHSSAGVLDSAEQAIGAATRATQDTVTVALEGYSEAPRGETVLFNMLNGFITGFGLMRLSTWGIRGGWWPAGNVRVRGRHVHHFVPGILIAFATGGAGLVTQNKRAEAVLAVPFGIGIGMTFDEAALLLELDDVYWRREGVLSVQVSLGMTAILATTLIALRMLRRGERISEEAGLIPDETGEYLTMAAV